MFCKDLTIFEKTVECIRKTSKQIDTAFSRKFELKFGRKNLKKIVVKKNIMLTGILFLLISCKSENETKIIGKWVGTSLLTTLSSPELRYCEMEFTEDGAFLNKNSDLKKTESYDPLICNYTIKGDSIKINNQYNDAFFIEFISESTLILRNNWGISPINKTLYELKKVKTE